MLGADAASAADATLSAGGYFAWLAKQLPLPFFHTQPFLVFLALVAMVYWSIPRRFITARVWLLVIASFHFYAAWSAELAFLVTGTTVIDYLLARGLDRATHAGTRRGLLVASIGMNLGILVYFKYSNFFLDSLNQALTRAGWGSAFETLSIIVPFGISFYTFEAISYVVDVYRRTIRAERSLPHFLLFILFFPHLVAGPIVRAGDFLTQAHRRKRWNWVRVQLAVQLFLMGVFKKMALADRFAQFCNPVFDDPGAYNTSAAWLAVIAFAFRIYFDFSGYSDMALGLAHFFGYRLKPNFNMPYLAANVSEFWRRWHISLSTWLRDYLFIPLGGSRGSSFVTARNLMITMLLGGLWHGATWSYVIWGGLHGLFLIVHRFFRRFTATRPAMDRMLQTLPGTALRIGVTFACVSLAWVFFRKDLAGAVTMLQHLFWIHDGLSPPMHNRVLWTMLLFVGVAHLFGATRIWQMVWPRLPGEVQGLGYAACLSLAFVLSTDGTKGFIYFDF